MTTLAAVLVRQKSAPLETVEQAMLRQSLFGGDLATNLLELQSIDERSLLAALALALGCPPVDPGPLGVIPSELIDVVPTAILTEYWCVPIASDAHTVTVVTASPLPESIELEFVSKFGKPVALKTALEVRIRETLARQFGVPIDARFAKVVARLDAIPVESIPNVLEEPVGPASQVPTPRISLPAPQARRTSGLPGRRDSSRSGEGRRLGPMTAANAESELSQASSPGEIVDIWLDFAAQYFDYTAIFAIQGDLAAGKQARGAGTTGEPFSHIGVPLDLPSALERARRGNQWCLTALEPRGLDRTLARDLGRRPGPQVLLLPISVRQRVVLVTYGDHGSQDVELDRVGDVLALRPIVERHLERLVVERKRIRTSLQPSISPSIAAPNLDVPAPSPARTPVELASAETPRPDISPSDAQESQPGSARSVESVRPTRPEITSDLPTMPTHLVPSFEQTDRSEPAALELSTASLRTVNPDLERSAPAPHNLDESWDLIQPVLSVGDGGLPRDLRAPTPLAPPARPPSSPPGSIWPGHANRPSVSPKLELVAEPDSDVNVETNASANVEVTAFASVAIEETNQSLDVTDVPRVTFDAQAAQAMKRPSESQELPFPEAIDEHESACIEVVSQLVAGDPTALDRLLELGDAAIGVLVREMPGPTTSPSRGPRHDPLVKASEFGPILRALVAFGPSARPYVIARTSDSDPKIRAWSVRILGELGGRPAATAIAQRVVLDRDAEVKRAAHQACQLLYRDPDSAVALRQALLTTAFDKQAVITQRLAAMDALTDLRDVQAIPGLIELLTDPNPGTAAGAGQALSVLTRQDFGYDQKKWNAWWQNNAHRERIEWIIDALDHRQPTLRQAASEELRLLSRLYVGDYDDTSGEARAKVQKKYRDWWADGGRINSMPPKR